MEESKSVYRNCTDVIEIMAVILVIMLVLAFDAGCAIASWIRGKKWRKR